LVQPGQYISFVYDGKWWLGNIVDKSEECEDVKVQFMHPPGPSASLYWPRREDVCWVPVTQHHHQQTSKAIQAAKQSGPNNKDDICYLQA